MLQRLIVLDCVKAEGEAPRPLIMFNPEITASSDTLSTYEEGCLSIPEQYGDVTRPAEVTVKWIDRDGNEQSEDFAGLWAPVCSTRSTTSTANSSLTTSPASSVR